MSLADYDATLEEPSERGWCLIHGMSTPCEECREMQDERAWQTNKEKVDGVLSTRRS
jgi:hypothetical protein